jgi:hypothetical protein
MPIQHSLTRKNRRGNSIYKRNMVIFDTNAILRYILQDNEPMALAVTETLDNNVCFIPVEVVAKIV